MSDNSNDDVEEYISKAQDFLEFVEEYSGLVDDVLGFEESNIDEFDMSDGKPLKKLVKDSNKVEVVIELESDGISSVSLTPVEAGIEISVGDNEYLAKVPSDVDVSNAEAVFKNGILTLELPRTSNGNEEIDVSSKGFGFEDEGGDE